MSSNVDDTKDKYGPLIGSIDEGTSSTRFLVFASKTAEVLTYHQLEIPHICEQDGWVEQDPLKIMECVYQTIDVTCDNLKKLRLNYEDIVAIGVANQRETTVIWNPENGQPYCNAIVWMDVRTSSTVDKICKNGKRKTNFLQNRCGLPVSTYFSALKLRWMMDNVDGVREAMAKGKCLFGTIDTWIIWNLTGGPNGGVHVTDVTNASRTMLMNIETLKWDRYLCKIFDIPRLVLPEIRSSSEIYGYIKDKTALVGLPISGILGDQQAALVGQMCLKQGQAKNTYGTGCFLLYNTGTKAVLSSHGLLTSVGYKFGDEKPVYVLEGSIANAGVVLRWLKDNLQLFESYEEINNIINETDEVGSVCFVPAFSGLYAPFWRKDARGVICGLTEETKPGHILKATLEAICFQVRDLLEAIDKDCGIQLHSFLVDGGMTKNDLFMQMQADYCGINVVRPTMAEATSLGAAIAAGKAKGVEVWDLDNIPSSPFDVFYSKMSDDERDIKFCQWRMGLKRSINWAAEQKPISEDVKNKVITGCCYIFLTVGLLAVAKYFAKTLKDNA